MFCFSTGFTIQYVRTKQQSSTRPLVNVPSLRLQCSKSTNDVTKVDVAFDDGCSKSTLLRASIIDQNGRCSAKVIRVLLAPCTPLGTTQPLTWCRKLLLVGGGSDEKESKR
jgi:hypothetical protein